MDSPLDISTETWIEITGSPDRAAYVMWVAQEAIIANEGEAGVGDSVFLALLTTQPNATFYAGMQGDVITSFTKFPHLKAPGVSWNLVRGWQLEYEKKYPIASSVLPLIPSNVTLDDVLMLDPSLSKSAAALIVLLTGMGTLPTIRSAIRNVLAPSGSWRRITYKNRSVYALWRTPAPGVLLAIDDSGWLIAHHHE